MASSQKWSMHETRIKTKMRCAKIIQIVKSGRRAIASLEIAMAMNYARRCGVLRCDEQRRAMSR
eukprot:2288036-Pyramimonas_sp.AAC.1